MVRDSILDNLSKLIHLDVDAAHAYDQAIRNVDDQAVKEKLIQFQSDHLRHIDQLSGKVRELGGTAPELASDFKGFIIAGFTALRSLTGTKGALEAMETNERLTVSGYTEASKLDFPVDVLARVQSNLADEQRHLSTIREALATLGRG
jgi:rubrerythrin